MKASPSNPAETQVIVVSQIDPKGSVPKSVAAGKMKEGGVRVAGIAKAMQKKFGNK